MSAAKKEEEKKRGEIVTLGKNALHFDSDILRVLVAAEIKKYGLAHHHLQSFNTFISEGIRLIMTRQYTAEKTIQNERTKTEEDQRIQSIEFIVRFTDVNVTKPETMSYTSGKRNALFPDLCRRNNYNYSAPIYVNAEIEAKAYPKDNGPPIVRKEVVKEFRIATIPIMVRSAYCNTFGFTHEMLRKHGEDPLDEGGYFIVKGVEWVIDNIESRLFNYPHIFYNVGHKTERCRGEFISKPGDAYENSGELKFILHTNDAILLTLTSTPRMKDMSLPFYILFRLYGMTSDKEIFDHIVYSYSTPEHPNIVSDTMVNLLKRAFATPDATFDGARGIIDPFELRNYIVERMLDKERALSKMKKEEEEIKRTYYRATLMRNIDKYFLPHIGRASDTRLRKLRFLGYLLHKLILVSMKIIESTDRDSYRTKRVFAAGQSYAKAFKTQFNLTVIQPIKKQLTKDFKAISFSQVKLANSFRHSVQSNELEKTLIQAIVTGNEQLVVKNQKIQNRLASQQLHLKNQVNKISTLRTIKTPSSTAAKQVLRADEMRRVHPSYLGIIDPIQSAPTGDPVGLNKQMAYTLSITGSSSSEILRDRIMRDPRVTPESKVMPADIRAHGYNRVFINGEWIGCIVDSPTFVAKYREMRRASVINRRISIVWEVQSGDVYFWTDAGRAQFPLLIVRNNVPQPKLVKELESEKLVLPEFGTEYDIMKDTGFLQDVALTKEQFAQLLNCTIDIEKLHETGVIEYISPDELENLLVAQNIEELIKNRDNSCMRYTHCFVPIQMFGVPTSTSPFADHNQITRVTYQTNQVKQTCGWYALNWPHRAIKGTFLQWFCDQPIVRTFADKYTYPSGKSITVAIQCYGGYNQEDSLLLNRTETERGMFAGSYTHLAKTELDREEIFGNPDEALTIDIKKHASYAKIRDGFVRKGDIVQKNDIVIGKQLKIPKPSDQRLYKDTSVVYAHSEPALVELAFTSKDQEQTTFAKIKMSSARELHIGDKLSARSGQKGVVSMTYANCDMPFSESGLIPDMILNPHAIPTRMTIGQLIESITGKLCVHRGVVTDGTTFNKVDVEAIADALEKAGFERYGTERMYNGITGEWIDARIFVGPVLYQRLLKFVLDERYSVSTGPTNALTRQPIEGKSNHGGLRFGEMEKDVVIAQGCTRFIMEKFRDDSDYFLMYICRNCGKAAIVNEKEQLYMCRICRDQADIKAVETSWATKLAIQEMESMNIGVKLTTTPYKYEV